MNSLKYDLLRKLFVWISLHPDFASTYDSLYVKLNHIFGIQSLDTTNVIYTLGFPSSWGLKSFCSGALRIYSSSFSSMNGALELVSPFSSDINHLSHVGQFYLLLGFTFFGKQNLLDRKIQMHIQDSIDSLNINNLAVGFSARVFQDWPYDSRSHAYVELNRNSDGIFSAEEPQYTFRARS